MIILSFVRGIWLIFLIGVFMLTAAIARLVMHDEKQWRQINFKICRFYARLALGALKIPVDLEGVPPVSLSGGYLVVCNHMSYVDIMVLSAILPTMYVTSVEIRDTFFLGHMCKLVGCLFVERRSKDNIAGEISEITTALCDGYSVTIFPEGTSGNGDSILPFKRSLLVSAVKAQVDVVPVCLTYEHPQYPAWYGDMDFGSHLLKLIASGGTRAKVQILEPIKVNEATTRDEIVDRAYEQIRDAYSKRPVSQLASRASFIAGASSNCS